jgi:hypothetical protein
MAKQRQNNRRNKPVAAPTPFEEARDELFQHIMRCGVVGAEPADVDAWFKDTMQYMADRFPELSPTEVAELRTLGQRFAQPPKARQPAENGADASAA